MVVKHDGYVRDGIARIDKAVEEYTKAGLPTPGNAGRLARVTDDVRGLWMDDGTQWGHLSGGQMILDLARVGITLNDPNDPTDNGGAIKDAVTADLPMGGIILYPPGVITLKTKQIGPGLPYQTGGGGRIHPYIHLGTRASWIENRLGGGKPTFEAIGDVVNGLQGGVIDGLNFTSVANYPNDGIHLKYAHYWTMRNILSLAGGTQAGASITGGTGIWLEESIGTKIRDFGFWRSQEKAGYGGAIPVGASSTLARPGIAIRLSDGPTFPCNVTRILGLEANQCFAGIQHDLLPGATGTAGDCTILGAVIEDVETFGVDWQSSLVAYGLQLDVHIEGCGLVEGGAPETPGNYAAVRLQNMRGSRPGLIHANGTYDDVIFTDCVDVVLMGGSVDKIRSNSGTQGCGVDGCYYNDNSGYAGTKFVRRGFGLGSGLADGNQQVGYDLDQTFMWDALKLRGDTDIAMAEIAAARIYNKRAASGGPYLVASMLARNRQGTSNEAQVALASYAGALRSLNLVGVPTAGVAVRGGHTAIGAPPNDIPGADLTEIPRGMVYFYLDEAGGSIKFVAKKSDGTTFTKTL